MHRCICNDNEGPGDHGQPCNIVPVRQSIETKGTQDRCTRHLDIQAIFVIDQGKESYLIDNEGFESVMENRQLVQVSRGFDFREPRKKLTLCSHRADLGMAS